MATTPNKKRKTTHRAPRVIGGGRVFPGIPGAVLFKVHGLPGKVHWPVSCTAMVVVLEYGAAGGVEERFLAIDPAQPFFEPHAADDQSRGVIGVYSRNATAIRLISRECVSRMFAVRRLSAPATVRKTIPDDDYVFSLHEKLMHDTLQFPFLSGDFFNVAEMRTAVVDRAAQTLVLPTRHNAKMLYMSFFESEFSYAPHLAHAAYNWCDHAFAAAIATVCTSRGGPVHFRRGAFVFEDPGGGTSSFYDAVYDNFDEVFAVYLMAIRNTLWEECAIFKTPDGERVTFNLKHGVFAHTETTLGKPLQWVEPEGWAHDKQTRKTKDSLFAAFSKLGVKRRGPRLETMPTLPPCILHAFGKPYPGADKAINDNNARVQIAEILKIVSAELGVPVLRLIDHTRFFAGMKPRQIAHYMHHANTAVRRQVRMIGPCRTKSRDVKKKGLTCLACPNACGRPNGVTFDKLDDTCTVVDILGTQK